MDVSMSDIHRMLMEQDRVMWYLNDDKTELFMLDQTKREAGLILIVDDFKNMTDREFSAVVLAATTMQTYHFIPIEEISS